MEACSIADSDIKKRYALAKKNRCPIKAGTLYRADTIEELVVWIHESFSVETIKITIPIIGFDHEFNKGILISSVRLPFLQHRMTVHCHNGWTQD